jgi:predicted transposase/invertase (TIGR01784 family)
MTELDIQARKDYAVKEARSEGLAEGEAKGKAEGRADEKLDIAKNMLSKGFDLSVITELTGLSEDALRSL